MGSLTITLVGDASVGTKGKTFTIPDADINRLVAFAISAYPVAVPATFNPDGSVLTPATTRAPTKAEALLSWVGGFIEGTRANVANYEKQVAAAAPVAAVTPITAT